MIGEGGNELAVNIETVLGRHLCASFGADSKYLDVKQFILQPEGDSWLLIPVKGTSNETLRNGKAVTSPTLLKDGDVLAVGREEKNVAKLPLTVQIV